MKIELGKIYPNKTKRFLVPSLKGHGKVFTEKFNNDISKLAFGIHDTLLDDSYIVRNRRPIFMLCDRMVLPKKFDSFLDWLRYQNYFIEDYAYSTGPISRKHMIVIEVPEEYNDAWDNFCLGSYSKMYTPKEIDFLFKNKEHVDKEAIKILSKDVSYLSTFISKLEQEFDTKIESSLDFIDSELEFPYSMEKEKEIFNYVKYDL